MKPIRDKKGERCKGVEEEKNQNWIGFKEAQREKVLEGHST